MCLAIEPMVNVGGADVRVLDDGWTAVTVDGSLSAHFELSVAVTEQGPWILSEPVPVRAQAAPCLSADGGRGDARRGGGCVRSAAERALPGRARDERRGRRSRPTWRSALLRLRVRGTSVVVELMPYDTTRGRIVRQAVTSG